MSLRARAVGCLLLTLLLITAVRAAPGVDTRSMAEIYADSDAVFLGHVVRQTEPRAETITDAAGPRHFPGIVEVLVEFTVLRSWKGMPEDVASIVNTFSYTVGRSLSEGQTYLVCAQADPSGRLFLYRVSPWGREPTEAEVRWLQREEARTQPRSGPELQSFVGASSAVNNGDFAEAARWCEKLVALPASPFYRDCQVRLGVAYQKLQRFREAVQVLTRELSEPLGTNGAWDRQTAEYRRADARFALVLQTGSSVTYSTAVKRPFVDALGARRSG